MTNFWTQIKRPFLALAPMAGITSQPFRIICKEFGANVLYSELLSSEAIWHKKCKMQSAKCKAKESLRDDLYKTLKLIQFSKQEKPYVVQIFGADPEHMAFTAEYIASGQWNKDYHKILNSKSETLNKSKIQNSKNQNKKCLGFRISNLGFASIPDGIDVNMGCPTKDVMKTGAGAALIKNPKLAEKIIKTIKKKVKNIPISVKTRIGWNDNKTIGSFARMCEQSGVDAIAIHGRTVKQGFFGEVDWEAIYKVKKKLKIPVIGNGGINIMSNIKFPMSKLDGVMIGNGALGRPWIFQELKKQLNCHREDSDDTSEDVAISSDSGQARMTSRDCFVGLPSRNDIKKIVLKHAELVQKLKGQRGLIEFRKHLGWYFKGTPFAKQIRKQLVNVNSLSDVAEILGQIS